MTGERTQITFAIPFYGSLTFLDRALTSVTNQTVEDWKAIIVDDCSPSEGALELVKGLDDPRITYVRNERNLGLAGNWNRCIELTSTPLVTLLHSDDELFPHYARTMLDAHAAWPNAAAVFCEAETIDHRGEPIFSLRDRVKRWLLPVSGRPFALKGEEGARRLLRGNFVMCPSLCYKRRTFDGLRFLAEWQFVLDLDFLMRGLMAGEVFVGVPDKAFRYRRHPAQATVECERNLRMFVEEIAFWRWAADESRALGWSRAMAVAQTMAIIKLQLLYYVAVDLSTFRLRAALAKLKLLRGTSS